MLPICIFYPISPFFFSPHSTTYFITFPFIFYSQRSLFLCFLYFILFLQFFFSLYLSLVILTFITHSSPFLCSCLLISPILYFFPFTHFPSLSFSYLPFIPLRYFASPSLPYISSSQSLFLSLLQVSFIFLTSHLTPSIIDSIPFLPLLSHSKPLFFSSLSRVTIQNINQYCRSRVIGPQNTQPAAAN